MRNNCQHVICLRILKHFAAKHPRAVARRAFAIAVIAAFVVVFIVVARRAVATVVVVGRCCHRVVPSPIAPSSTYVLMLRQSYSYIE
jgi:hypothetical protein